MVGFDVFSVFSDCVVFGLCAVLRSLVYLL